MDSCECNYLSSLEGDGSKSDWKGLIFCALGSFKLAEPEGKRFLAEGFFAFEGFRGICNFFFNKGSGILKSLFEPLD